MDLNSKNLVSLNEALDFSWKFREDHTVGLERRKSDAIR